MVNIGNFLNVKSESVDCINNTLIAEGGKAIVVLAREIYGFISLKYASAKNTYSQLFDTFVFAIL
jgi:hypothetical protein